MTIKEYNEQIFKSESQLQIECVNWFRQNYPNKIIYAIPNGGSRNVIEAVKMKREGILKGIPESSNGFHSLYIEMKFGKNKPSKEQLEVFKELRLKGNFVRVCWTKKEFVECIINYFK